MKKFVAPNHLRLRYDIEFDGAIAGAGTIVKILKELGTPEYPEYEVEAFSGTRLTAVKVVPDYAVESIELLTPPWYFYLNLKRRDKKIVCN